MKIKFYLLVFAFVSSYQFSNCQQRSSPNDMIWRIGFDAGGFTTLNGNDVKSLVNNWFTTYGNMYYQEGGFEQFIGGSGIVYMGFNFLKFLEVQPELDYSITSQWANKSIPADLLTIKINDLSPGVSFNFLYKQLQIGAGIYKHYISIRWQDNVSKFSDLWKGNNWGYNLNLGVNFQSKGSFGTSITFVYKNVIIDDFRNSYNDQLLILPEKSSFKLNFSQIELRFGFYFSAKRTYWTQFSNKSK